MRGQAQWPCPITCARLNNWPQQHYENGVAKNDKTNRRFKGVVRILKRLRNEMADEGIAAAKAASSYLIECLVWNVPNHGFGRSTYTTDVRTCLEHLFVSTRSIDACKEWGEINELKYLFRPTQPWTLAQADNFIGAAWEYIGFEF